MNLGVTSLAAPNAASSSTARYSATARPAASGGRPAAPSTRLRSLASAWRDRNRGPSRRWVCSSRRSSATQIMLPRWRPLRVAAVRWKATTGPRTWRATGRSGSNTLGVPRAGYAGERDPPFHGAADTGLDRIRPLPAGACAVVFDDATDASRDPVLEVEDVFQRAVEVVGPQKCAAFGLDQLCGDPHATAGLSD